MTLKTIPLPEAVHVNRGDNFGFLIRPDTVGLALHAGQATIMFAVDNGAVIMLSCTATPLAGDSKIFSDFEVAFSGTYHSPPSARLMPTSQAIQKQITACIADCNLTALIATTPDEFKDNNATQMAVVLTEKEEFQGGGGTQEFYVCMPVSPLAFLDMQQHYKAMAGAIKDRIKAAEKTAESILANKVMMPTPGTTQ